MHKWQEEADGCIFNINENTKTASNLPITPRLMVLRLCFHVHHKHHWWIETPIPSLFIEIISNTSEMGNTRKIIKSISFPPNEETPALKIKTLICALWGGFPPVSLELQQERWSLLLCAVKKLVSLIYENATDAGERESRLKVKATEELEFPGFP